MGRTASWPPKPHRHKPTGQARVRHGGRDYYLGPWGTAAARAAYVRLISELDAARKAAGSDAPARPKAPTLACVAAAWRSHAEKEYGGTYEAELIDGVLARLLSLWPAMPAAEFAVDRLEEFRDALVKAGLCRNVVNKHVVRLRTVWRFAERKGYAPKGSWSNLRTLPALVKGRGVRETPRVRPAEWADVEAVCLRVRPSVRGLLLVQWYTGARPSELMAMRVGDLAVKGGVASYEPPTHKNAWRGHERRVVLGPKALDSVAGLVAGREASALVFPNRRGLPYNRTSYYAAVMRGARAAGVRLHPYQIRHAFKRRATAEMGLDAARSALGQASILTTDKYAAGGDEKLAAEVARKCG